MRRGEVLHWQSEPRRSKIHFCSCDLLLSAGDLNLNVVAMALSGYTDEKSSLWREMCSSLRLQLKNPYLCVMFAFLTSEPGAYDGVLVLDLLLWGNFRALLQTRWTLMQKICRHIKCVSLPTYPDSCMLQWRTGSDAVSYKTLHITWTCAQDSVRVAASPSLSCINFWPPAVLVIYPFRPLVSQKWFHDKNISSVSLTYILLVWSSCWKSRVRRAEL